MKISLRTKLIEFARGKNWVNGSQFEQLSLNEGKKASNGSRRCRELADEGIFERRLNGKSVEYRLATDKIPLAGIVDSATEEDSWNLKKDYQMEILKLLNNMIFLPPMMPINYNWI